MALSGFRIMIWGMGLNTFAPLWLGSQENYLHIPSRYRGEILSRWSAPSSTKRAVPQMLPVTGAVNTGFHVNLQFE